MSDKFWNDQNHSGFLIDGRDETIQARSNGSARLFCVFQLADNELNHERDRSSIHWRSVSLAGVTQKISPRFLFSATVNVARAEAYRGNILRSGHVSIMRSINHTMSLILSTTEYIARFCPLEKDLIYGRFCSVCQIMDFAFRVLEKEDETHPG
jgi:hypothetical protein